MTPVRPGNKGSPVTPYLNSPTPICLFTIQLSWDTMTIKGSLQESIAIVKAYLTRNFVLSKIGQKFAFWEKMGSKCKILFSGPPKGTSLREMTSFDVLIVKIDTGASRKEVEAPPPKLTSRVTVYSPASAGERERKLFIGS